MKNSGEFIKWSHSLRVEHGTLSFSETDRERVWIAHEEKIMRKMLGLCSRCSCSKRPVQNVTRPGIVKAIKEMKVRKQMSLQNLHQNENCKWQQRKKFYVGVVSKKSEWQEVYPMIGIPV